MIDYQRDQAMWHMADGKIRIPKLKAEVMKLTGELGGQMVSEDVRVHHVSWPNHVMQPRWQRGRRSRPDSSPWFAPEARRF
jgi:hypothetical protein